MTSTSPDCDTPLASSPSASSPDWNPVSFKLSTKPLHASTYFTNYTTSAMSPSDAQEKKSKWRIPGIGHSKDPKTEPLNRNSASDSTYGSEPSSSTNNAPSLTGSDASRKTQNQYERNDQGQVVTTTTTTTTTTTSGGGPQQASQKHDPGQTTTSGEDGGPPIPVRSSMRERSPNPGAGHGSTIRERSPNMSSPTNGRSNFSYPSRTPPPQGFQAPAPNQQGMQPSQQSMAQGQQDVMRGQQQTMAGQQSTLANLKSAAVGIHVRFCPPRGTRCGDGFSASCLLTGTVGRRGDHPWHSQFRRRSPLQSPSRASRSPQSSCTSRTR